MENYWYNSSNQDDFFLDLISSITKTFPQEFNGFIKQYIKKDIFIELLKRNVQDNFFSINNITENN